MWCFECLSSPKEQRRAGWLINTFLHSAPQRSQLSCSRHIWSCWGRFVKADVISVSCILMTLILFLLHQLRASATILSVGLVWLLVGSDLTKRWWNNGELNNEKAFSVSAGRPHPYLPSLCYLGWANIICDCFWELRQHVMESLTSLSRKL